MNEALIDNWNSVVRPEDKVYHLGDACMGNINESLKLIGRLNGQKWLIPGNHDRCSTVYSPNYEKQAFWTQKYSDAGFLVWHEKTTVHGFLLCHYPYTDDSPVPGRHAKHAPPDEGEWLLHGHTHSSNKQRDRQIHVGVDAWDYTPVSLEQVRELTHENI